MRPGWVKPCECGNVPRGVYCEECRAFGDGFSGGTWERPALQSGPVPVASDAARDTVGVTPERAPAPSEETWCPGGHRGATVRGNAAYCAECNGRLKPTASSKAGGVGTGH